MLRFREHEVRWLGILVVLTLAMLTMSLLIPERWPLTAYIVPSLLAMNVLALDRMFALQAVVLASMITTMTVIAMDALRWGAFGVILCVGVGVLANAANRSRLGVALLRGESMLVDLRDRLASQSQLPVLPEGWRAEVVLRSAGGASFAGDFVVATKDRGGSLLEVVVVDVSGKGVGAGTRSLQLSGAFGGLLGSLPPDAFLPAANEYLLRQEWSEGFATAIHLALDLSSGRMEVRTAGHPPAVQLHAGSGRWEVLWTEGPVLGVVEPGRYHCHCGQMLPGDVLMLYTDGLVETRERDISTGIDKLLGQAERLTGMGFERGAEKLVASVENDRDDRALLLLHRRDGR